MTAALNRRQFVDGAAFVGPQADPPPAVLELVAMIWRRKGLVLGVAVAVLMLAAAALSVVPKRYDAVAEVLVEPKAPKVLAFDEVAPGPELADVSPASEVRMILSPEMFARAVDRLRLTDDPEFNPDAVAGERGLIGAIRARARTALGWVEPVAFRDAEAEARLVRAVAIRKLRSATLVFPVDRSRVVAVRVTSRRAEKSALIANTLVDLHLRAQLDERRLAANRAAAWLEERLRDLTIRTRETAGRVDTYRAGEAATAGFSADAGARLLRDLNTSLANARADGLTARAAVLERTAEALRTDLLRIAAIEAELARLDAEAEAAKAMQSAFRTRLAETRAQAGVQRLDARVVAPATAPTRPASPNARMILALALAGGLALGAGCAALAESLRAPFRTPREVRSALDLPVLAAIPRAPGWRGDPLQRARRRPASRFAEAARDLRGIFTAPRQGEAPPPKVVAVASALAGEGKSTLAALLAEGSARSGKRTLLIDCDLRRPSAAALFGVEGAEDVVAVLSGEVPLDEAAWRDPATGVHVLTALPCPAACSELFATPALAALLADARNRFDAVILDTPPALALADARLVAAEADATILAIRWGETPQEEAVAALQGLQAAGANVSGVALTFAGRGADYRIDIASGGARYGRFSEYFAD